MKKMLIGVAAFIALGFCMVETADARGCRGQGFFARLFPRLSAHRAAQHVAPSNTATAATTTTSAPSAGPVMQCVGGVCRIR